MTDSVRPLSGNLNGANRPKAALADVRLKDVAIRLGSGWLDAMVIDLTASLRLQVPDTDLKFPGTLCVVA